MRRRFTLLFLLPAVALMPFLVVAFGACASQGEGERCSPEAGNAGADDCQSGLQCLRTNNANAVYRCCPADRTQATTAACALPGTVDANSSVPEAATATEASSDATDVRSDGPVEGDGQNADSGFEAATDALSDVAGDALLDGTTDTLSEATADVTAESAADARPAPETSTDAATDSAADAATE